MAYRHPDSSIPNLRDEATVPDPLRQRRERERSGSVWKNKASWPANKPCERGFAEGVARS